MQVIQRLPNMALERPAGSHSLTAAAHRQRSPHRRKGYRLESIMNLRTAKALGLTRLQPLLLWAD